MPSNASSATGIPNETAKKRKGAPSANEIFTAPVPVTDETIYTGDSIQTAPRRVFVNQSNQVGSLLN